MSRLSVNNMILLSLSSICWIILWLNPFKINHVISCVPTSLPPVDYSLKMILLLNPLSELMFSWGLMIVAMMLPKIILPIGFIYASTFKHLRFYTSFAFFIGYSFVWMIIGIITNAIIITNTIFMPSSYVPALCFLFIAIIWQLSPIKQYFLNLSQLHPTLSAFGLKAFYDNLMFGVKHGIYCVGTCWALMLFAMSLPKGHLPAMFIITIIMISEHLEQPRPAKWSFVKRDKLLKIILAQIK